VIACVSPCPANFCLISATEWFQHCVLIRVLAPTKALGKSDPEKCLCGRSSRRSSCWHSGRTCSRGMLWSAFPRQSAAGSGPDPSRMAYEPGSGSGPASSRTGPSSSLISSHYAPYGPAANQSRLRDPCRRRCLHMPNWLLRKVGKMETRSTRTAARSTP
jgi:hypothetical protein